MQGVTIMADEATLTTVFAQGNGIANQMLVPPSTRALIATCQPCVSANWRTMARPSPLPPVARLREGSRRKKGRNTAPRIFTGMPWAAVAHTDQEALGAAPPHHLQGPRPGIAQRVFQQIAEGAPERQRSNDCRTWRLIGTQAGFVQAPAPPPLR